MNDQLLDPIQQSLVVHSCEKMGVVAMVVDHGGSGLVQ